MIESAIEYLNELLKLDPSGINVLFTKFTPVNDAIADHPHAVVGTDGLMGPLGLLNGLMSLNGLGLIEAVVNDHGVITEFRKHKSGCSSVAEPPVQSE